MEGLTNPKAHVVGWADLNALAADEAVGVVFQLGRIEEGGTTAAVEPCPMVDLHAVRSGTRPARIRFYRPHCQHASSSVCGQEETNWTEASAEGSIPVYKANQGG